jgi:hypothetical protein
MDFFNPAVSAMGMGAGSGARNLQVLPIRRRAGGKSNFWKE